MIHRRYRSYGSTRTWKRTSASGWPRARRDSDSAAAALERLRAEAADDTNLMPAIIDAARAHVTVGEMCDTLRATWGVWRETPVY